MANQTGNRGTIFRDCPRWAARLILVALATLVAAGALLPPSPHPITKRLDPHAETDVRLYQAIVGRVESGQTYYAAAAAEQRAHHYPTWPPQSIREPTEAVTLAALHNDILRRAILIGLALAAVEALRRGLARTGLSPRLRLWALALGGIGLVSAIPEPASYMHEIWASVLLTLALSLRRDDRWALAVCAGLMACLVRETALPALFVLAACAAWERRWREAASWAGAIALFAALYAGHLALAAAQHRPHDLSSPGWIKFGGLPFVLATLHADALLVMAPDWLVAAALGASTLGYLGCRKPWVRRWAGVFLAYAGLYCVVGRPDNDYWGFLYAPMANLGLALAPVALRDLAKQADLAPGMGKGRRKGVSQALTSRGS